MRILVLVGPKGSGKTYIGQLIEEHVPGATFLSVEDIAIDFIKSDPCYSTESFNSPPFRAQFFDYIRECIDQLNGDRIVVFESTGAAPETKAFFQSLSHDIGPVHLVRIRSSASTCADRIKSRDNSKQVDVSREMISRLHATTESLEWAWELELVNENLSKDEIVQSIIQFLS